MLLLAIASLRLFALDSHQAISQYIQTVWTTDAGLPQTSVYSIAQTPDGYVWVGTEQGLASFDGVRFTVLNRDNTPALPDNYIHRLLGARDGSLWIGTDSGLVRLKDGKWTVWTSRTGLTDDGIEDLAEGPDGSIWIATDHGLNRLLDGKMTAWHAADGLPGEEISALRFDDSGVLWVALHDGLARFDGHRFTAWTHKNGLPEDAVSALAVAPDGSAWAAMAHGQLIRIQNGRVAVQPVRLPRNDVRTMLFDHDGNLWLGFQSAGLARLHNGVISRYDDSNGLPGQTLESMFEDAEHNLWLGLFDGGLVQLRDGLFKVFGAPEGLTRNMISCAVAAGDGSIWAGNYQGELNHVLPGGGVRIYTQRDGLSGESIHSMLMAHDGSLWLGHRHGMLTRYSHGRFTVFRDPQAKNASINGLLEDRDGTLWVAEYGAGFARFLKGHFLHAANSGAFQAIAQSADGAIWLGSDGDGVFRYWYGVTTRFTTAQGLLSDHIDSILASKDGNIWVGEGSGGLNRIRDGHVTSYRRADGLFDSTIGDLVEDRLGNLWMGSDRGVARVAESELNAFAAGKIHEVHSVSYDTSDGMRSRETLQGGTGEGTLAPDGQLLFPTLNGIAIVDPARAMIPSPPIFARMESLSLDGSPIPISPGMRVHDHSGRLRIRFTAVTFTAPRRVRFRYRLEGYDREWIDAGTTRSVEFTNLPPGNYRLTVEAARPHGSWDQHAAQLGFSILPPWYRTWYAWLGYDVLAALFVWCFAELRSRSLVRRRRELQHIVAQRTAQLKLQNVALAKAREALQVQATHDSLTGLWNRGAILEHLDRELRRAHRERSVLTVVLADLDHFKSVNDNHGHICGDRVLHEAATRLVDCLRGYDVIGRYGGEEFLILMPGWDPTSNPARALDLLSSFNSQPFQDSEADLHVTCSFGVAVFRPSGGQCTIEDLISSADRALYRAKTSGRNRTHIIEMAPV